MVDEMKPTQSMPADTGEPGTGNSPAAAADVPKRRRRRRRPANKTGDAHKKQPAPSEAAPADQRPAQQAPAQQDAGARPKPRRRRGRPGKKRKDVAADAPALGEPGTEAETPATADAAKEPTVPKPKRKRRRPSRKRKAKSPVAQEEPSAKGEQPPGQNIGQDIGEEATTDVAANQAEIEFAAHAEHERAAAPTEVEVGAAKATEREKMFRRKAGVRPRRHERPLSKRMAGVFALYDKFPRARVAMPWERIDGPSAEGVPVTISTASAEHIEGIVPLLQEVQSLMGLPPAEFDELANALDTCLGSPEFHGLVATSADGAVIGFTAVWTQMSLLQGGKVGRIDETIVTEGAGRTEVASALLASALQAAQTAGCTEVEASAAVENEAAVAFYRRRGFELSGLHFRIELPKSLRLLEGLTEVR